VKNPIYLDNAATTPIDPQVLQAMLPYLSDHFGNPASLTHPFGATVEAAVQAARRQIAQLIGAQPQEIIFTSGATEANNLAIIGIARKYRQRGNHIITCQTEHKSILDPCAYLEQSGFEITYLPVDAHGMIDLTQLKNCITNQTILISLMAVNNETGVIHPLREIGDIARTHEIFFHCDASQATGKIPLDVRQMNINLLSINAHKLYGPKGIGALYLSPAARPEPLIHGGGQERQIRSGTLNVPGIIGLAKACELATTNMEKDATCLKKFADQLEHSLPNTTRNGHPTQSVSHIRNLCFDKLNSETLILAMPELAISSGAACTNTSVEPSYVLKAMHPNNDIPNHSLRLSLGRFTTENEITAATEIITNAIKNTKKLKG
jgi:cysteine desulfurase